MAWRVVVALKPEIADPRGAGLKSKIRHFLGIAVDDVRVSDVYTIDARLTRADVEKIGREPLCDGIIQEYKIAPPFPRGFHRFIEVGFLPGVTDNVGTTARQAIETILGRSLKAGENVYTSQLFAFKGALSERDANLIANEILHNPLIQQFAVFAPKDRPAVRVPKVRLRRKVRVERLDLAGMSDDALAALSKERLLALNGDELRMIQARFGDPSFIRARKRFGLDSRITDVELECLAQTWSEHCKHKIFNATIRYEDERGRKETIRSLFKTYIRKSTEAIDARRGDGFLVSVFVDNAGVITFNKDWNVVFKVETHNSPSALDPYGGALTGIVGVNRDVLGTGIGARLVFNTDVFCFADPFYRKPLPPRILHPRRIYDGVVTGVEHGGNKSGIPTVNGSIVFDDRFLGKPLVYCGTGGLMPKVINGRKSHEKHIDAGDLIVMCGGRIGKDGIHGATFSSEELHEGSPATAVQIGDPITQKKMADFLYRARDLDLYNAITDNGAGGLSSSVGEMAQMSGGCEIELDKAPLKYAGLNPWEILVSESQERMSLAVPRRKIQKFLALSEKYGVESTVVGRFTASSTFHVTYKGETVAFLPLEFLHGGLPEMVLTAKFTPPVPALRPFPEPHASAGSVLRRLLGSLNICSKEAVVRKYDHEVQGMSVVKPFTGAVNDGPSDGAVLKLLPDSWEGIVVSHGICPKYSDYDAYNMAAVALDEAIRNAVCCGGDPSAMACLDNFCWCDPVASERNPDGSHKLAQLVRANKALYDYTMAYGVPCISGKDSMKNDYIMGKVKISIPPTLLFSLVGIMKDVRKAMTMDVKGNGDVLFVAGLTADELAGSEYASLLRYRGGAVPAVDAKTNAAVYRAVHRGITTGIINAAHDCSDGGFAVAVAEMCLAGGLGARISLDGLPYKGTGRPDFMLFSESAGRIVFTVPAGLEGAARKLFAGLPAAAVGTIGNGGRLDFYYKKKVLLSDRIDRLKRIWQKTLKDI